MAHRVEKTYPELDSVLLTAIEQTPHETEGLSFFQHDIIQKAVHHSFEKKWASVVPGWKLFSSSLGAIIGLIGICLACFMLFMLPPPAFDSSIHLFSDAQQPVKFNLECTVQPGHTEIERGTHLLVLAEFAKDSPSEADLYYTNESGEDRIASMTKSLDDPVFASRIMQVEHPLTYWVKFADQTSEKFSVNVFEYPRLVRTDAELNYPKYTNLPQKSLQDTRRFSAVVGTEAKLLFHVNKEVRSATLRPVSTDNESITLTQNKENLLLWETNLTIEKSAKYRLHLLDQQQRENKSPPQLAIKALTNQPPELKLLEPARDIAVSAIEEVSMRASVRDDFGVARTGLAWSIGGGEPQELELASNQSAKQKHVVDHLLELESLQAKPDQLVAWHFWAEDLGPDGSPRRTQSDMFFAEVRRFEEIFFEAQGQSGQQQQQGQQGPSAEQAMELAELQKEIINATWRVIRREKGPQLTDAFDADVKLIAESQQEAIAKVDELAEKLKDELAKSLVGELKSIMNDSVDQLEAAQQKPSAKPLPKALSSQQSAWQTLLKMRAREVQVGQSQQQQSSQSSSSQSSRQRQLQQMELTEQEDRYEQERLAQEETEQAQQQRENRQILNRLKELAQRQNDLNKRVKELQSALEEAESEQEKEELEKQLKRLEEEQEQVLRDTDELQETMEESQSQPTEQMEQIEQARENVQRSSEALQQGDLSKAATEGTRAERELKDLRDDFQKQTAGQFNEQMRQMRNEAQDLQKDQKELSEKLRNQEQKDLDSNRLDSTDKRKELVDGIREGQEKVENLREQIKETIEEADEIEPLLADELYDTYRETEQTRPDRALRASADAIERGYDEDAEKIHEVAMEGIEELREGIDRAAERVLGDETESLKAARDTIKDLSRELDDEIQRNNPGSKQDEQDVSSESSENGQRQTESDESSKEPGQQQGKPNGQRGQRGEQPEKQESKEAQRGSGKAEGEGENAEASEGGESGERGGNQDAKPQKGNGQGQGDQQPQKRRGGNRLDGEPSDPSPPRPQPKTAGSAELLPRPTEAILLPSLAMTFANGPIVCVMLKR